MWTVQVPPRLDIGWTNEWPRLGLTGMMGYAYAPELPWTNAWLPYSDPGGSSETALGTFQISDSP